MISKFNFNYNSYYKKNKMKKDNYIYNQYKIF